VIKRTEVLNGFYGDSDVNGNFCANVVKSYNPLVFDHINLNSNKINLPDGEGVLNIRLLSFNNIIYLAGQGHDTGRNLLYNSVTNKWITTSGVSFSVAPNAFFTNSLYIMPGPNSYQVYDLASSGAGALVPRTIGSQGIRYIDFSQSPDGIVTGDSTYGPGAYEVAEWTLLTDVVVGQSYVDGCTIVDLQKNKRYQLEPGNCRFLHPHRFSNQFAIPISKTDRCVFYWLTLDDFSKLSPEPVASIPNPSPSPNPIPLPIPSQPKEPSVPTVTPDQWINVEWPQLEAQFKTSGLSAPNPSMVAFMTLRRFGYFPNEVWSFERLMADLIAQGVANGTIPKEVP